MLRSGIIILPKKKMMMTKYNMPSSVIPQLQVRFMGGNPRPKKYQGWRNIERRIKAAKELKKLQFRTPKTPKEIRNTPIYEWKPETGISYFLIIIV